MQASDRNEARTLIGEALGVAARQTDIGPFALERIDGTLVNLRAKDHAAALHAMGGRKRLDA